MTAQVAFLCYVLLLNAGIHQFSEEPTYSQLKLYAHSSHNRGYDVEYIQGGWMADYAEQAASFLQALAVVREEAPNGAAACVLWKANNIVPPEYAKQGTHLEAFNNWTIPLMRRAGIAVLDPGPVTKANAATPDLLHHNNIFGPAIFLPLMQSMARLCP